MKIRHIEITNFKCHTNTQIYSPNNLHVIIGANSTGKTSVLDACKILTKLTSNISNEVVNGNIENDEKFGFHISFEIELSKKERDNYFRKFFYLSQELIDDENDTHISRIIKFKIASIHNDENHNLQTILSEFLISGTQTDHELISILALSGSNLLISDLSPGIPGRINNNPYVDKHLKNLKKTRLDLTLPPLNSFPREVLNNFIARLKFSPNIRISKKITGSKYYENLNNMQEGGEDLVSAMLHMYLKNRDEYEKIEDICKRIFIDIKSIHPYPTGENEYTIAIKKKNLNKKILLNNEGTGIDQILIIIWSIASSNNQTIWFLDEPELHLHPGAQKLLYDFFIDETKKGKQIFVATHSMVFIHKSKMEEITLLINNQNKIYANTLDSLIKKYPTVNEGYENVRRYLYDALGYNTNYSFDPKTIILVEGQTDENVLVAFSKTIGYEIKPNLIRFYPIGNKRDVKNFSPVLAFALSNKKCIILVDNDKNHPNDILQGLLHQEKEYRKKIKLENPILTEDNFFTFPENVYSIEYYLFEAEAICKAFNKNDFELIDKVNNDIKVKEEDLNNKKIKPKDLLSDICYRYFQEYDEVQTPTKIAKNISKGYLNNHTEIINLIDTIRNKTDSQQ